MDDSLHSVIKSLLQYYRLFFYSILTLAILSILQVELRTSFLMLEKEVDYYWSTTILLFTITSIPLLFYYVSNKAKFAKGLENYRSKLNLYYQVSLYRFIGFLLVGIMNALYYLLVGNQQNILFAFIIIILFLISKPSKSQFENEFV